MAFAFWVWAVLSAILSFLLLIALDQVAKYLIDHNMTLYDSIPVIPDVFEIHYIRNAGAAWGDGVADKVSNMFSGSDGGVDASNMFNGGGYSGYDAGQVPANIADTAANTGKAADSLDITSEDLKYLRDIAETEAINRFTTAEIKVEMTNNNNVSGDMDLDGMVDYLANGVNEAMEKAAEGVHD